MISSRIKAGLGTLASVSLRRGGRHGLPHWQMGDMSPSDKETWRS